MFSIATETTALATGRSNFVPNYPCQEGQKKCLASGVRVIDGFQVHRDCWEWGYNKICNYPSKNNCDQYAHCYFVALLECLLTDSLGNCVNRKEEYSCKRWIPSPIESQKVRVGFKEKEGPEGLVCKGIPC
ncbi:MAG: conjugal transfer protein TraN, partial [Candidatus Tisiphia sp.]